ncbi:MAG: polysulfide reductase NrfD [Phycisphaerales bacterium]|jgi:molybdopterin-containing oxidoreductase family membrane subunit|nr:polysulfide reductase NrfD [Phycisphaerales bacterium]
MAGEQKIRRTADMLPPVVAPQYTVGSVSDKISEIVLTKKTPRPWYFGVALTMVISLMLFNAIGYLLLKGVGIWGVDVPVAWGFAIVNFVWWIGIGHAGTLISAILLLLKQEWRTSINRFAEAMTLFAVACAGMFPLLHLGRPWVFYWLFPYPDTMGLWPQWRSPLVWDVFAVSTYATVSLLFWYVGLIPDLATLRDKAQNGIAKVVYGIMSLGWRGSAIHWHRYEIAYLLLGGLATPLVVSVHSIVGMDFAGGIVPGWHSTIFPPYFVAGAIFSGFAMVATLTIPLRKWYGLEGIITIRHLDNMGKIMLATGLIVAYGYAMEVFIGYYSDNTYEWFMTTNRMFGPYAWAYWMLIFCNIITPITLWSRKVRTTPIVLFVISIIINIGMWMERYVIVITSLHRDFLPSSWGMYAGTQWDWMTYLGTLGFFALCLILFIRVLPMISMFEMRQLVSQYREDAGTSAQVALQED